MTERLRQRLCPPPRQCGTADAAAGGALLDGPRRFGDIQSSLEGTPQRAHPASSPLESEGIVVAQPYPNARSASSTSSQPRDTTGGVVAPAADWGPAIATRRSRPARGCGTPFEVAGGVPPANAGGRRVGRAPLRLETDRIRHRKHACRRVGAVPNCYLGCSGGPAHTRLDSEGSRRAGRVNPRAGPAASPTPIHCVAAGGGRCRGGGVALAHRGDRGSGGRRRRAQDHPADLECDHPCSPQRPHGPTH